MESIDRKLLKENGKIALKGNFWMIMLVVFVGSILGAGWTGLFNSGSSFNYSANYSSSSRKNSMERVLSGAEAAINDYEGNSDFDYDYDYMMTGKENVAAFADAICDYFDIQEEKFIQIMLFVIGIVLILVLVVYMIIVCIQFLIGSFLCAPIGVGYQRYFMKNRKGEAVFTDLFSVFTGKKYMQVVKSMFTTNIRIWGWSLLFYFPGMVKYYEYYFVKYIMAENSDISSERARDISRQMAAGHKWQIFVLELSFLGWMMVFLLEEVVLAAISCGILAIPGVVLLYPLIGYMQVTFAELYAERREYALMTGMASQEELIGF